MITGAVDTLRLRGFLVRFGMGIGALRGQCLRARTLLLLVRHERVCERDIRPGIKSPSSLPSGPSKKFRGFSGNALGNINKRVQDAHRFVGDTGVKR